MTPHAKKLDPALIRCDFPVLHQLVHGHPLVYLDNANTTQKPSSVIEATQHYYTHDNANIHRSVYQLSERATQQYEATRDKIRALINAKSRTEIIFTKGTTDSINLIATALSQKHITANAEIIISEMEHHSNIVPWQLACERTGAKLKIIPILDDGALDLDAFHRLITPKTCLVALTHISSVLGTHNPVKEITTVAHAHNIPVLLDGAQAVPHLSVDVQDIDCDFYVFSAHKMYGPTGVGVLYGRESWLDALPPYQGGGSMIRQVSFEKTTYADLPYKFEAGTPNIAGVIGLGHAVDYLNRCGLPIIQAHEQTLLQYATEQLTTIPGLRLIGTTPDKAPVISFTLADIHPHDAGTMLDTHGVALRVGHHCAMPTMERFGVPATLRASFAMYNTREEVDVLVDALHQIKRLFA